jgi:hypothetical protein
MIRHQPAGFIPGSATWLTIKAPVRLVYLQHRFPRSGAHLEQRHEAAGTRVVDGNANRPERRAHGASDANAGRRTGQQCYFLACIIG